MSLTIAGSQLNQLSTEPTDHEAKNQKPVPTPTTGEVTVQLASTGQPTAEIAANLGEPISEVESTLGITTSSSIQTGALTAQTARLSVRV